MRRRARCRAGGGRRCFPQFRLVRCQRSALRASTSGTTQAETVENTSVPLYTTPMFRLRLAALVAVLLAAAIGSPLRAAPQASPRITTPAEQFGGHNFGDDYFLANYKQIATYWQKLATQSNRVVVQSI